MTARANTTAINHSNGTGTWRDITRNLISGNTTAAIRLDNDDVISPSTDQVRIQRNRIGFNRTLGALLLNAGDGIGFANGSISSVLIGGLAASQGNEISGTVHGISINNATNVIIRGNTIARVGQHGIRLAGVNGATIGGDAATVGNTIGGTGWSGIYAFSGTSSLTVSGNQIGVIDITGGTYANQQHGILLQDVSNVTIGNGGPTGRNVISGNGFRAIQGQGANSAITISGNYIGTDATGNVAVANAQNMATWVKDAVSFDSGSVNGLNILNNVMGGHEGSLIDIWNITATNIVIQGNSLGVGANGTSAITAGNMEDMITFGGATRNYSNVLIGGFGAGEGNLIANSARSGIRLESSGTNIQVIGNTIRNNARNGIFLNSNTRAAILANRIFGNGLIGIDLDEDGVTLNDAGDGDAGSNDRLNFPVIGSAHTNGTTQLTYAFTLDVPAAANGYRIDFFANTAAHSSGHGEGERFLGSVDVAHAGGSLNFSGVLNTLEPVALNTPVTATASRRTASGWDITSEFSAVATAAGMAQLVVAMASSPLLPAPPAGGFATPGSDMVVSTTVSNVGTGPTHADSIFVVVSINADNSFLNAASPEFGGGIGFASAAPSLTFTPGTDLGFSNAASPPSSFAQCTYAPAAGADPQVRYLCLNPKGTLPPGAPDGQFTVQLRTRIH